MDKLILKNGQMSITFLEVKPGLYRPEWIRENARPMLRFKDHEWLNIGGTRVEIGELIEKTDDKMVFGGKICYGKCETHWQVTVSLPFDNGEGFTVFSKITPTEEMELLEALTSFETPYEYLEDDEDRITVISQQPVYKSRNNEVLSGAGYNQPIWYYAHKTVAHLTYPCSTPLLYNKISNADGSNVRHTIIFGNWNKTTIKDIYAVPTKSNYGSRRHSESFYFQDPLLKTTNYTSGMKFLVGALNWHTSLYKDPNLLIDTKGISQEVTIITKSELNNTYDDFLAESWSRLLKLHLPKHGVLESYNIARDKGVDWLKATEWLHERLNNPNSEPYVYDEDLKTVCYTENTRPYPQTGKKTSMPSSTGQLAGPLSYVGTIWDDDSYIKIADKMEKDFCEVLKAYDPRRSATIGLSPMLLGILRKMQVSGLKDETTTELKRVLMERCDFLLNPPNDRPLPDSGTKIFDTANTLLAGKLFDDKIFIKNGIELLTSSNELLDNKFWNFNCATVGDPVGAGQSRPFGHAIGITANLLAFDITKDEEYLKNAKRFADLTSAMHFIVYNESPAVDLDTRGWAHGSTGGRDQMAQMPPWETGLALQQFGGLMEKGVARDSIYDLYWYFAKNGLAQFPKARILKRGYRQTLNVWEVYYRPIEAIATERDFYLNYPYMAYENPWDQTMLALYQGVEPIIQSMLFGDGIVFADNRKVQTIIPAVANYDTKIKNDFTLEIWNPLSCEQMTSLRAVIAEKRGVIYSYSAENICGTVDRESSIIKDVSVPPRKVLKINFTAKK